MLRIIFCFFVMGLLPWALPASGRFQLVTEDEYRMQLGNRSMSTEKKLFSAIIDPEGPRIRIERPNIGFELNPPFDVQIAFEAYDDAVIELDSLEVLYGWLSLDITERIKQHAELGQDGILARNVELPEGKHSITINIQDSKGRRSSETFQFIVQSNPA